MTDELRAEVEKVVRIVDHLFKGEVVTRDDLIVGITALILATQRAEREVCCKALCVLCAHDVPMSKTQPGYHQRPDYIAQCSAAAIRAAEGG